MKPLLVASSIALCACAAEAPPVSTTSSALETGRVVPTSTAIERITHAQCGRTEACGTIEQRGASWTADYCQRATRAIRDDMGKSKCANIDSWRLDACFEAIRLQSCQRLSENGSVPADCGGAALCR
jgi:hypothetical protein